MTSALRLARHATCAALTAASLTVALGSLTPANAASGSAISDGTGLDAALHNGGTYYLTDDISVYSVYLTQGVSVKLDLNGHRLTAAGQPGIDQYGIHVPYQAALQISDSVGDGSLTARGPTQSGILNQGSLVNDGARITAIGGTYGAGIGADQGMSGELINTSGSITATGGTYGAGIGGGQNGFGSDVTISGGSVRATNGSGAPTAVGYGHAEAGPGSPAVLDPGSLSVTGSGVLRIPADSTLAIPSGASATIGAGAKIVNGGTIEVTGTLTNDGTIADDPQTGAGTITETLGAGKNITAHNYRLSFMVGPNLRDDSLSVYGDTVTSTGRALPDGPVTQTGYAFNGWWTAPTGGTQVTDTSSLTDALGAGPKQATLYAHFDTPPAVQQPATDKTGPTIASTGLNNGGTVYGPAPTACQATDVGSGVRSCTITTQTVRTTRYGKHVAYTATATDNAGNTTTSTGRYRQLNRYVQDAPLHHGRFQVGQRQVTLVISGTTTQPRLGHRRFAQTGPKTWQLAYTPDETGKHTVVIRIGDHHRYLRLHVT